MSPRKKLLLSDLLLFIPGFALLWLDKFEFSGWDGTIGGLMVVAGTVLAVYLASRGA